MIAAVLGVAAGVLVTLAAVALYRLRRVERRVPVREVLVHTRDDQSIRGMQVEEYPGYIVLEDARHVSEGSQVDAGRVRIPRSNEAWTQELAGGS